MNFIIGLNFMNFIVNKTFDFIHSKKRNKLACRTARNIVKVHCNLRLVDRIEEIGHYDDNIHWSSDDSSDTEWLLNLSFCKLFEV